MDDSRAADVSLDVGSPSKEEAVAADAKSNEVEPSNSQASGLSNNNGINVAEDCHPDVAAEASSSEPPLKKPKLEGGVSATEESGEGSTQAQNDATPQPMAIDQVAKDLNGEKHVESNENETAGVDKAQTPAENDKVQSAEDHKAADGKTAELHDDPKMEPASQVEPEMKAMQGTVESESQVSEKKEASGVHENRVPVVGAPDEQKPCMNEKGDTNDFQNNGGTEFPKPTGSNKLVPEESPAPEIEQASDPSSGVENLTEPAIAEKGESRDGKHEDEAPVAANEPMDTSNEDVQADKVDDPSVAEILKSNTVQAEKSSEDIDEPMGNFSSEAAKGDKSNDSLATEAVVDKMSQPEKSSESVEPLKDSNTEDAKMAEKDDPDGKESSEAKHHQAASDMVVDEPKSTASNNEPDHQEVDKVMEVEGGTPDEGKEESPMPGKDEIESSPGPVPLGETKKVISVSDSSLEVKDGEPKSLNEKMENGNAGTKDETAKPIDASEGGASDDAAMSVKDGDNAASSDDADGGNPTIDRKKQKHVRSKHTDPKVLEIRRKIQIGCRDNDLESAMKAYHEAIENNIRVEAQSFYNLLNLCDGLERTVHVGTPKGPERAVSPNPAAAACSHIDNKQRQEYAFKIKEHMEALSLPLNEAAYTAIVKVLIRNKEYEKAEEILDESESVQQCKPRLRLYAALLSAYSEERHMLEALSCWLRITKQKLDLTERELLALMQCAIGTGDAAVFDRVVREIAELVPVPSKETVSAILEWFESPHAVFHEDEIRIPKKADEGKVKALLNEIFRDEVEGPPSLGPIQSAKGWLTSSAVTVDHADGTLKEGCLKGCKLQPVPLSERAWNEMLSMNEKIVLEGKLENNKSKFQGGRKGEMRNDFDPEERKNKWTHFVDFLEARGKVDVVIDAANVGYFKQNFADAPKHVDYEQIDWVAQRFLSMNKKVLLVLHERHFSPNLMPEKYQPLQSKWEQSGILYKTPAGMNDDWFWLHVALKHRSLVLTNDEMRDHHFQMLAPRIFLRWKERHQVHFNFGEWENTDGDGNRGRRVNLEFPSAYSRRIQRIDAGLAVPLIKKGDENRFLDGSHVADDDEPSIETYLCIREME